MISDFLFPLIAIQPETVRERYKQRNIRPARRTGDWQGGNRPQCGASVFLGGTPFAPSLRQQWSYLFGFMEGFDGNYCPTPAACFSPDANHRVVSIAHSHGKAVWEAVKDLAAPQGLSDLGDGGAA